MTLRRRLAVGLTTLVLLSAVGAGAGLYALGRVTGAVHRTSTQDVVALEALDDVESALYRIRASALEHLLAGSDGSGARLAGEASEQERRARDRLADYRRTGLSPEEERLAAAFERHLAGYVQRVRGDVLPVRTAAGQGEVARQVARGAVEEFRAARQAVDDLMDQALRRAGERAAEARRTHLPWVVAPVLVVLVTAAVGQLVGTRRGRRVLAPLRRLVTRGGTRRPAALDAPGEDEPRFRSAFAHARVGMAIVSLDGRWLEVNAALGAVLGTTPAELLALGPEQVTHPEDRHVEGELVRGVLGAAVQQGPTAAVRHRDVRYLHRDGRVVVAEVGAAVVLGRGDQPTHCLLQVVDVTEARRSRRELEELAHSDPLTGLANRDRFLQRLHAALAEPTEGPLRCVLFVDIDRFKFVNDVLGHRAGDELLVVMARRIESCLRRRDTVARFGGDEYTVLLEDVRDTAEAVHVAELVLEAVRRPLVLAGQDVVASASVGIACSTGAGEVSPDDLLHDADVAVGEARTAGGDCYRLAGPEQRARSRERLGLETDLRAALDGGSELEVHYQPIVRLDGGAVAGVEALVRWRHPERGLLAPAEFLHLAEDTGLVVPLGRWVLGEACRTVQRWAAHGDMPADFVLHVNLSARQLRPELLDEVDAVLSGTGYPADQLCLEVTESALAEDDDVGVVLLQQLSRRGVRLAIDDFGTEYSALGRLRRLPVTCLKIDKVFVADLASDGRDEAIVRAITDLARSMELEVVAEGVETPAQEAALLALGCDVGQGYALGRAQPPDAAGRLVVAHWRRTPRAVAASA
ncbi:EAL domain-containing protein [Geodermatophilus sp. DSM 44513]|uniref:EAL domain-containing protein n=1 Tax=Geodermatophilus sp. DSM 44513 TaxID=1528104 RepID=UPI00127B0470|nr:EAL domain-containing protein [Geodermatophilus sp. DSM 44513]WNV75957.1 EAL domain-containing protein [Geodermatophilus sp. DSM 44513]